MDAGMGVRSAITFFYYRDLEAVVPFYRDTLGLRLARDQGWCKIFALASGAYLGLVDERFGSLRSSPEKPVMVSLVVDDVDAWHRRLGADGVAGLTRPRLSEEIGVYGFFCEDPAGYTVEFQRFDVPLG